MHVTDTTPYPWPWDGRLSGRGTALVAVLPPGGAEIPEQVAASLADLAGSVQRSGGLVITATTTAPARLERGVEPPGSFPGVRADHHVTAGGVDAFYASDLDLILRTARVERLLLAGWGLETAVHSTMRDANDRGLECLLVLDACVPIDPDLVPAAVSTVEMSGGIFGAVGRTDAVVEALSAARSPR